MLKRLVVLAVFLMPILSFAQGGGHVGHHRHRQQQQQQQQSSSFFKYEVITGDEARFNYETLLTNSKASEVDLSSSCSAPVKAISFGDRYDSLQCFDRGEDFRGSRYKCYKGKRVYVTIFGGIKEALARKPKMCGGDGIHQIRQE